MHALSGQWKMSAEDEDKKSVVADVSGCLLTIKDSCCVRRRVGSRSRVPGWRDETIEGPAQKSSPWHTGSVISTWIISRAMTCLSASWLCSCLRETSPCIWPKLDICQTPVPLQSDSASNRAPVIKSGRQPLRFQRGGVHFRSALGNLDRGESKLSSLLRCLWQRFIGASTFQTGSCYQTLLHTCSRSSSVLIVNNGLCIISLWW